MWKRKTEENVIGEGEVLLKEITLVQFQEKVFYQLMSCKSSILIIYSFNFKLI